jgi:hypothetical protein
MVMAMSTVVMVLVVVMMLEGRARESVRDQEERSCQF